MLLPELVFGLAAIIESKLLCHSFITELSLTTIFYGSNVSEPLPPWEPPTNNVAEIMAVIKAIEIAKMRGMWFKFADFASLVYLSLLLKRDWKIGDPHRLGIFNQFHGIVDFQMVEQRMEEI